MKPLLLLLFLSFPLAAEDGASEPDLMNLLGNTHEEVMNKLGSPEEIYTHRGSEAWQDNVVFFYGQRIYLFWYRNRVWQVRLDRDYEGSFLALSMGDSKETVVDLLGDPFAEDDRSIIYHLPDRGYPIILRLFFRDEMLEDLYLYRGDF